MGESKSDEEPLLQGEADSTGYRRALPDLGTGAFSTKAVGASANGRPGGLTLGGIGLDGRMDRTAPDHAQRRRSDALLALKTIFGFWAFYLFLTSTRAMVLDLPGQDEMLKRRLAVLVVAILLSALLYLAMLPARRASIGVKIAVAAVGALPAAAVLALVNYYMFYVWSPEEAAWMSPTRIEEMSGWSNLKVMADSVHSWYFFFAAWAAIYVALSYSRQLREADRRAAVLTREAQEAQLRALRYQINPHFLFNTLNSLSSLVLARRNDTAERMLMNLSAFFRTTLATDPTADVSLAEEIQLQRLYLEIEQVRFPDRLSIEIDVPEHLLTRRVPVLILQPVVENCVKYGVARARRPVTIGISAYEEAGRLHLKVRDDGDGVAATEPAESTGVGLRNVCDRLASRFGEAGGCIHGADAGGGYTVHIFFPAVRGD